MLPAVDKKTLLFDLDETLVHCNSNSFIPGDVLLNISHEGEKMEVILNNLYRPH
jgi:CTD small phosphatase-like protein 2